MTDDNLSDRVARIAGPGTAISSVPPPLVSSAPAVAPVPSRTRATRPFAAFEWMIALRYLRARRAESFISVISIISLLGITLGVATLITVMSVMNGFRAELQGKILGFTGHMTIEGTTAGLSDFDAVAARARAVPGITRVTPVIDGQVIVTADSTTRGAQVVGMRPADIAGFKVLTGSLSPPAMTEFRRAVDTMRDGQSVLLGSSLARRLGLVPGMQVTLMAPRGNVTPFGTTPRVKSYTVAGTFDSGMEEYNGNVIFMPLDEAQLFFNLPDAVSKLEIDTDNADGVDGFVPAVLNAASGHTVRVYTWHDLNLALFDAVQVEHNVMFLILTLIMIVASLNIISGLIMLVKDKSADIAIMRTMGATRGAMMRVFLIAGASIGIVGTLGGLLLGVLVSANIDAIEGFFSWVFGLRLFNPDVYFLTHMPSKMESGDVIAVAAISLLLSLVATLYPSWRAARLDPVEALRYE